MWVPLVKANHLRRAGEVLGQVGAVPARLLVGPLAGHEGRHVDPVHEGDRRERVGDLGPVVAVGLVYDVSRFTALPCSAWFSAQVRSPSWMRL